ncbi:sarcosine oxidase subunit alpha family protein [Ruegeria sp. WL0004]|uniref:Sarcosine oxidase subunit alpha family protein n=1 Tax=Ruegeria marisflavi TaxID=2984152 RepID=A0ABT2WY22_9RHOB|nr:sarcosine oxidase subunit alpha family protein [Ruegeria sp. WL0004]MCU9840548.1 sarcosine oxidase subunit alpha family protein [Ruegeria sp. WL0004]
MRLPGKGLIDRAAPVRFRFDGREFEGYRGDTLASALLANGVKLVARSFKYHRPRGVMGAGSEEANALVTVGTGAETDPNVRATVQEVYGGLEARSQNRWPSLNLDILALNDLASPFLTAGFYYKTFMWPRSFWEKLYEPMIRRSAGLGALSGRAGEDRYEAAFAFCDVLVIGAGPAGLMAALTAARAGASVILCDEDSILGGRLNGERTEIDGKPGYVWAREVYDELASMDNVRLMRRTTVIGAYDQGTYGALERVGHHLPANPDLPLECFWRIVAKRAILAAGAIERPIAFRNNDRPGIMTAGAVRTYVNRYGVAPGKSVTLFCNNDGAYDTVRDLMASGVGVQAIIDSRQDAPRFAGAEVIRGAVVGDTRGRKGLRSVAVETGTGLRRIETDCLAMSGGWNPSVHLTCHLNGRPVWNADIQAFVPKPDAVPGLIAAGACNGDFTTSGALREGASAALSSLEAIGLKTPAVTVPETDDAPYRLSPLWFVPGKGRAWLDFQNDVTVKDVRQAARENFASVEHMKRYTTQGMAPDQGKNSNVAALAVLADATGRGIPETGTTTFRPPFVPVSMAAMGAGGRGKGLLPQRFTTSHEASVAAGAPMDESGLWYRPAYFPQPGETTWRQSCDREVAMVRSTVGICDVSTLGKIDVQGMDAGRFLDFVYSNTMSTLKPGRVRYGLMLREDGHVMDDGTAARLAEDHYVLTTTTAAAGQVMRHLEFVHQCLCPHLEVSLISTTEQWAQFSVAGPRSRDLLAGLLDKDLSNEAFPFMACGEILLGGMAGRLFRISFSGELAYEVAVPSCYGESLFTKLLEAARAHGGGPYGMEALNVLRIEKGFITHSEIDGRVTAADCGLAGLISKKKDCIGKAMSERPGLSGAHRMQMVGLRSQDMSLTINSGSHIFEPAAARTPANDIGYVTSACYAPTLKAQIALGFVVNGAARLGETVLCDDPIRGEATRCTIVGPVQFDPEGDRGRV